MTDGEPRGLGLEACQLVKASCLIIRRDGMFRAFTDPTREVLAFNTFFKKVEPILRRYGGCIQNVNSQDITIVGFGVTLTQPDHSLRAVCTALELRNTITEWEVSTSIGINSGEVAYGPVGSPERLAIGIWGDNVRLASFLANHAASLRHDIIIGEGTLHELPQDIFIVGDREQITVVQDQTVVGYTLVGYDPRIDPASITEPLIKSAWPINL